MNDTSARVERMRDQQLDRSIRAIAVIGIFALMSSLARSLATGWHPVMALHVALYLLLLVTLGFRRRLRFGFRAAVVVLSCFLLGLAALLSWGFLAFGPVALFCACILATLFFGRRTGAATALLCLLVLAAVAVGVMAGGLVFDHDPGAFPRSTADWINGMMALALAGGIVIGALGAVSHQMEDLVRSLERQNGTLAENNRRLEQEMTERRRAEEERGRLERSLQMARRMESIGKLAGGVAHDLNNTLGSIVGYPDLLLEDLPADSPMRDILINIRKSGIKAAAIVNDMVTLSRNGVVATDIVSLKAVVGDYCAGPEFRQLRAYHPGVEVDLCLAEDPLYVRGSFFHLSKVIMNLASNAAEAMPAGGRLSILTEKRRVPETPSADGGPGAGEFALLRVADTGIGIAEEDLDRIYEPFYTKKTMGRSGTGLGMSVVWGSVQDHGGTIEVDSVEGKGTVFTVRLPLSEEAPREETPAVAGAGGGKGERILVVDDVEEQRQIASRILGRLGYSVCAVGSGEEALRYLRRAPADLLVLDMHMEPGIDGVETLRQALRIHPRQKALIATGYADAARLGAARSLGAGGCLPKPYLYEQIRLAVRSELDKPSGTRG